MIRGFLGPTGRAAFMMAATLALASCSGGKDEAQQTTQQQKKTGSSVTITHYASMPDMELKGFDGSMARLSAFRGDIVIFSLLATWQIDSARQVAVLNELHAKLGRHGFRVFGIIMDDVGRRALEKYLEKNAVRFPVYYNGRELAAHFGGSPRLPTTYILLRDGSVYDRKVGFRSRASIEDRIKVILGERL
jgi:peroxiredoxin